MYDDLIIDAPFWPDGLIEVDNTPFPKSAVSALAGFSLNGFSDLGDEIQMIEGLGSLGAESAETCGQVSAVSTAIAAMGVAACNLLTDPAAKAQCASLVMAGGAGVAGTITGAMGCGTRRPVTVTTRGETAAEAEIRVRREIERQQRSSDQAKTQNMLLIGGGVAVAAVIALIALRR
jgi:hypothetical protein